MKVTLAYPYTTPGGRKYKPDSTVEIEDGAALRLLDNGLARRPDSDATVTDEYDDDSSAADAALSPEEEV